MSLKQMQDSVWESGIWGPVTATLDWCEANYQFSPYIAEMANTLSNLVTVVFALHGANMARIENLPARYSLGFLGFAIVGIGSFAFHATLLYEAQLADELPMIFVATSSCFALYDTTPGFDLKNSKRGLSLAGSLTLFNILFSWSYWQYRNPIYHQVVFAILMLTIAFRVTYLLNWSEAAARLPSSTKSAIGRIFGSGSALFTVGFIIWNLDNVFCPSLTRWKVAIGWPAAFLLEGHSWWHLLTAAGTYLMCIGVAYLTLCVKDSPHSYDLGFTAGCIPHNSAWVILIVFGSLPLATIEHGNR